MDLREFIGQRRRVEISENIVAEIHHSLMRQYGWIPFEEFKKIPIPTVFNLLNEIKKEYKEIEKLNRKRRLKNV
ncbi:MAG: hypothetical protein DRQ02_06230 [Candidatus Latescibacterota bacterium]|nr:MAG: hypothetical protein DRQ02_06230 [Candidatus Latescibacterota bacterium]RLI86661.1 MAG: hypothetical protein DRO76_03505 [Candidatus Altiarchaeales archaeon]